MPRAQTRGSSERAARRRNNNQVSTENQNTFPFILFQILSLEEHWFLQWSMDGRSVIIRDTESIVEEILPNYFKTGKYGSFTRQFHMYEFERLTDGRKNKGLKGYAVFRHSSFQRDRPDLLCNIARKSSAKQSTGEATTPTELIRDHALSDSVLDTAVPRSAPAAQTSFQAPSATVSSAQQVPRAASASGSSCPSSPSATLLGSPEREIEKSPTTKAAVAALNVLTDVMRDLHPTVLVFVQNELSSAIRQANSLIQTMPEQVLAASMPPQTTASPVSATFAPTVPPPMNLGLPTQTQAQVSSSALPFSSPASPTVSTPFTGGLLPILNMSNSLSLLDINQNASSAVRPEQASLSPATTTISATPSHMDMAAPLGSGQLHSFATSAGLYSEAPASTPAYSILSVTGSAPNTLVPSAAQPACISPTPAPFTMLYPPPLGAPGPLGPFSPLSIGSIPMFMSTSSSPVATATAHAGQAGLPSTAPPTAHSRVASSPANFFGFNMPPS